MLFMVKIVVRLPGDLPKERLAEINKNETARSMQFVREGKLKRIFRIVGQRANFSIWETASLEELHATLTSLPLHPYMDVAVGSGLLPRNQASLLHLLRVELVN